MEFMISPKEFQLFREYIYETAGIALSNKKVSLVQGRLSKRLRQLGFSTFEEYYEYILEDDSEVWRLIDAISTNVTSFFREPAQWEYLKAHLQKIRQKNSTKRLRIWSSACSSGEEPYSIAIFLAENLPDFHEWDIKILATDISVEILKKAQRGVYPIRATENLPSYLLVKYFVKKRNERDEIVYEISDSIKKLVIFRIFNLIYGDFSLFSKPFDLIFCRNVMIYFDSPSQQALVSRFAKLLKSGDLLLVGHSEALTKNKEEFLLLQQSIYERM